jgi:hypothetical protein
VTDQTFIPGPSPNTVQSADGEILTAPESWLLLPPGDAALTRRVKAAGDHWVVAEKKGRKVFSCGVWAPAATIERIRAELEAERATDGYTKRKEADAKRRDQAQAEYVEDFLGAVVTFFGVQARLLLGLPVSPQMAAPRWPGRSESRFEEQSSEKAALVVALFHRDMKSLLKPKDCCRRC